MAEDAIQRMKRINDSVHDSFESFNRAIAITKKFPSELITILQKKVAFQALRSLIKKTPVGNPSLWKDPTSAPPGYVGGHARANWMVGIGQAPTGEVANVDPIGTATENEQKAVLGFVPPYSIVFIVNNVNYILWLEDGSSTQAPNGMLRVTLAELETEFMNGLEKLL